MMLVYSLYCAAMMPKVFKRSQSDTTPSARSKILPNLSREQVGDNVPRRGNKVSPVIGSWLMRAAGWRTVGEIPNISQAVVLALPHTSNVDGVYAIPSLFALDLKISIMAKHTLFRVPILSQLLYWMGIIPINRTDKGSVLQASIDKFKTAAQRTSKTEYSSPHPTHLLQSASHYAVASYEYHKTHAMLLRYPCANH